MRLVSYVAMAGAVLLAACGQPASTTATSVPAGETDAVWVLCDGVNEQEVVLLRGGPPGATATLTNYDKSTGATVSAPLPVDVGDADGAMGSVYRALTVDGREIGQVRQANPGMFENPASAWTTPVTSVKLGDRDISCRWLPRTRLMGITGKRTVVVHEDADGDLIYTTYDFPTSGALREVELSENARTTTFSVEVRGGAEHVSPEGAEYVFDNNGYRYTVTAKGAVNQIEVRHGDQVVQTEPLLAFVQGTAENANQTPN